MAVLAISVLWILCFNHSLEPSRWSSWKGPAIATAGVILIVSMVVLLTSFDRGRSHAWLCLDWFVPSLRRLAVPRPVPHSLLGRVMRRMVPNSFQSNHQTKRRGLVRIGLRRLGLSWLASPARRLVQVFCLATFLTLFFIVCWPYSAKPPQPGKRSGGWTFTELKQQTGEFLFRAPTSPLSEIKPWYPTDGDSVYVFKATQPDMPTARIGHFRTTQLSISQVSLTPVDELTPEMIDAFTIQTGPFVFQQVDPTAWPSHYAANLETKEVVPAEIFLVLDPLVSLSTAIASRSWVWSLASAASILIVCILIPRGFCGYLCPLGTTIDLFDWAVTGRVKRFRLASDGWWVHIKYYLLAGTLVAAASGVLVSGFFAAIPIITRGMLFLFDPWQSGLIRGWHLVPAMNAGHAVSILMFFAVLSLGFFRPRFWCKYVCPSGAIFSLGNLFRVTERKVESTCINCNKCVEICPFDAIKPDFTTRTTDCTMCQSCGGVCPTHAIKFVERWNLVELKVAGDPPTNETALGRRGFLSLAAGSTAAAVGGISIAAATKVLGANLHDPNAFRPVRPPGSVPEQEFLELCIRCGECFKSCPNNVLQPEGFQQGLEGLWTPLVDANWAGCESSCNACGQVCPTGAIRALPLEEKRFARIGLASVDKKTCLPFAGADACDLCVQECSAAGYHAIEYTQVHTELDETGLPVEGSGFLAPVVLEDLCVGCGLCQTRCYAINVKEKQLLSESAIVVEAGEGREDRLMSGSYRKLHAQRERRRVSSSSVSEGEYFIPDTTLDSTQPDKHIPEDVRTKLESSSVNSDDPFGVGGEF